VSLNLPALAAWFAASLVVLIPLQRWMTGSLQRLLAWLLRSPRRALMVYAFLMLPGVTLHELSHWLAARALGVRATSFSLFPKLTRNGNLRLGYVQTEAVDPLRASLIGAAPLATGTAVLWLLGARVLSWDVFGQAVVEGRAGAVLDGLHAVTQVTWWGLWLYLAVVVSNTMLPSRADRAGWGWVGVAALLLAGSLMLFGWGEAAANLAQAPLRAILTYLAAAFTLTAVLDLLLGIPLWALEVAVRRRG
jgi:hypothetical protein